MKKCFDRLVETVNPAAFYLFPRVKLAHLSDDERAQRLLVEEGFFLLPGDYFGVGGRGSMRLSFENSTIDTLDEMLRRMDFFQRYQMAQAG